MNPREKKLEKPRAEEEGGESPTEGDPTPLNHSIRHIVLLTGKKPHFLFPAPVAEKEWQSH